MKKLFTILAIALCLTTQAQNNKPDELVNLALTEDANVTGSVSEGRGLPADILYDPATQNYAVTSKHSEYGVKWGEKTDLFFWKVSWKSPKTINYITVGGAYGNQPQADASWQISYIKADKKTVIESGVGDWLDAGIFEKKLVKPIVADELIVEVINSKSIHLRARGGVNDFLDDSSTSPKATLIQYLPVENQEPAVSTLAHGKYQLFKDNELIFQHVNAVKVLDSADNTKAMFKEAEVIVKQPDIEYLIGKGGNTIASIRATTFKNKLPLLVNEMTNLISEYHFGSEIPCDSENSLYVISDEPFDFRDHPLNLYNVVWFFKNGLLNNGKPITEVEALSKGLILSHCDNFQLIVGR
ncbi:hypothetical protein KO504_17080 [Winogradskyella psychrotolerans]|uniref:hypothetical protein n=1 Tax=Winogradskyella psychrotolerans TaxID=1344585 RepID=UPI001C0764C0|nr:hypothetical protein [Winogradskyella psychrotolerans]MBU2923066.1 hypothetical protein [Winogradskyella psychrotolerans]